MSCKLTSHKTIFYNTSLQFAADVIKICVYLQILQNAAALITKCVGCMDLLQNAAPFIAQFSRYYKMPQSLLQNVLQ